MLLTGRPLPPRAYPSTTRPTPIIMQLDRMATSKKQPRRQSIALMLFYVLAVAVYVSRQLAE